MKKEFDRTKGIGGSDATRLYEGDWYQLWSEKVGETPPVDLSDVLPVQMGVHTEPFNISWYQKQTGNVVTRQQEYLVHPKYDYIYAHIDGVVTTPKEVFVGFNDTALIEDGLLECKHTNAFSNPQKCLDKYIAQIQHYLMVSGFNKAYMSIFFGNMKYEIVEVEANKKFQLKLLAAEVLFWYFVKNKKAPPDNVSWDTFKQVGEDLNGKDKVLIPLLSRI
tara:strand:+ start:935 stop:1594 length:660 start_codon:yes stop_codon:yes gene_type:complete